MKTFLAGLPATQRWLVAILLSAVFIYPLTLISMPANVLLGAMIAAIILAVNNANLHINRPLFLLGQSIIGGVIAGTVKPETVREFIRHWPLYMTMVLAVLAISALLGWLVAKQNALPGATAIWGISPGAAPMMILLSERYNADPRLVAVMQYLRVVMVSMTAGIVAKIWGSPLPAAARNAAQNATWTNLACSVLLCLVGCAAAVRFDIPSAAIIFPMLAGAAAHLGGLFDIHIPWSLILVANVLIGWGVGFRFDRPVIEYATRLLPKMILLFAVMIALCGAAGIALGTIAGVDPLTAFLATGPGGMDSMAIVALSIGGNTALVMAVQMVRFILTSLTGTTTAKLITRLIDKKAGSSAKSDS